MLTSLRIIGVLLAVLAVAGCSTTTSHAIDVEYKNPSFQSVNFSNIAVIVLEKDRTQRIANESVIAERMDELAVDAQATYHFLTNIESVESEEAVRAAFADTDFDGILTISTVKSKEEYSRGSYYGTYFVMALLGADDRAATSAARLADKADYYGSGSLVLNIGLWDVETLEPVWDATTKSYEFDRGADGAKEFADFVSDTLVSRGLIAP